MEKIIIFDTETTGFKKENKDAQIIEAAWIGLDENFKPTNSFEQRYKPSIPIDFGAMATHNIIEEDLVNCPASSTFKLPEGLEYMIGHNIDYDWDMANKPDVKRICTMALARKILPELDSHTQTALIYYFSDNKKEAREMVQNAHSALTDVRNCSFLLNKLIEKFEHKYSKKVTDIDHLWRLSEAARIPDIMPFGKHQGMKIEDLPGDYKAWILKQPNIDPYVVKAVQNKMNTTSTLKP